MDFFSSQHDQRLSSAPSPPTTDQFAQEVGRRFSHPLLTARLSSVLSSVSQNSSSPTPTTTTTISLASPHAKLVSLTLRSQPPTPAPVPVPHVSISSLDPSRLPALLQTPQLLVLDIRSHANYSQSRIPNALSLSLPSTLLKRPAYPLEKLTEMLSSASTRRRFSSWRSAAHILVYDADSHFVSDGSNIRGLLRKFENQGFLGSLSWLKGGFAAVWREHRNLVDSSPPYPGSSEEEEEDEEEGSSSAGYLRSRRLPSSAFQQSSTTVAKSRPPFASYPPTQQPRTCPAPSHTRSLASNPFYDNIRQNRELEHGITERIPLHLPPSLVARRNDLPFDWLKDIVDKADNDEGTESLAMQFYHIELREQWRLMSVMYHDSRETNIGSSSKGAIFPYSIIAGIEKGTKNRYQNIWPFEHARVRLQSQSIDDGSDYINASHVQPLGTRRRYIATQGPLPSTYSDFWMLCWEQNVQIIVMLTKLIEGALEKCGCYWRHNLYGPLRLELVSSTADEEIEVRSAPAHLGFDFGMPTLPADLEKAVVRRTFLLSHINHPEIPPRKVTQLQYLGWPDYDVPDDPRGILGLIRQVDALRVENDREGLNPVLLHCSAGIGRTGGFILVDAALDGIRHEMEKCQQQQQKHHDLPPRDTGDDEMDVDAESPSRRCFPPFPARRSSRRRRLHSKTGHESSSGLNSDDSVPPRSSSPTSFSKADSSEGFHFLPSVFPADMGMQESRPVLPLLSEVGVFNRSSKSRSSATSLNDSCSLSSNASASIFSKEPWSREWSTTATSSLHPLSVESSRSTSPTKDGAPWQENRTKTFDYANPRQLHSTCSPKLLSQYVEPVRNILEDMREQRMSLCQSLRQYVFAHRAIVEGALEIIDEILAAQPTQTTDDVDVDTSNPQLQDAAADEPMINEAGKRGPSPTELPMTDQRGAERLTKRPSFKRRERTDFNSATTTTAAQ